MKLPNLGAALDRAIAHHVEAALSTDTPPEDFAGEARAVVETPKGPAMSGPLFQLDDQVAVVAEYHKDHGRHGVVAGIADQEWPIGVRLGTGLGRVVHYFREDELAPQAEVAR